jgi:hypothetical protein
MTRTRGATALVAVLALVLGLAACGDGGHGPSVASLGGATPDRDDDSGGGGGGKGDNADNAEFQDAMLAYAKCMRSHGIDMPDPTFDGEGHVGIGAKGGKGAGKAAFEKADKACHHIIEDAEPEAQQLTPQEQAELQDQMLAMARCMRSKGHDMPDPQVDDDGKVTIQHRADGGGRMNPDDPDFQKDMDACSKQAGMEAPKRRGGKA